MVYNITGETTFQCRKRKHGPLSLETIIPNVRRKHMVQCHKRDHVTKRTKVYGPSVTVYDPPPGRVEQTLSLSDPSVQWSFVHPQVVWSLTLDLTTGADNLTIPRLHPARLLAPPCCLDTNKTGQSVVYCCVLFYCHSLLDLLVV